ncbi:Glycosyl transferase family 2 [compost metagenome]
MITVGITTYNRPDYLTKALNSLLTSKNLDQCQIRIYDDKSTELNFNRIKEMAPSIKEIVIRERNLGADENIRMMYENFLDTSDEIFFNGDADLLFHPDWVEFLLNHFDQTDGVLSLYNSNLHRGTSQFKIKGSNFNICPHLGSAGTAFSRRIVEKIVREMQYSNSKMFDWKWSKYLLDNNIRLISSDQSYIQHIGISGQNANGLDQFNYGLNYFPGNDLNTKYLIEFYEELLTGGLKNSLEAMDIVRQTKDYRLGKFLLNGPRAVKRFVKSLKPSE